VGVAAAIAIRLAVYIKGKNAKKFRKNLEYGSARWGTAEDIKPYVDPAFENNIILTADGAADHEQPPQRPENSAKQKCPDRRRQRFGQDPLLVEAQSAPMHIKNLSHQLRRHRSQRGHRGFLRPCAAKERVSSS